jgi:CRISPR-associated protein (TIGR02584 family)
VVALVGVSPGVVTELLWWLVMREGVRVSGLELWGSERIRRDLTETLPGLYAQLCTALGPRRDQVPRWNAASAVVHDAAAPIEPLQLFFPTGRDGRPIEDVANATAAEDFARALDRRMEILCSRPEPVVGSLAGGRKAMGSALHAAFTLRARSSDRLVHVLLHPAVERALGVDVRRYACPVGEVAGIPVEDQLSVYAVPFVPVAEIAARGREQELLASLRRVLHEVAGDTDVSFAQARDARCVDLVLGSARVSLGWASAAYLAALIDAGPQTPRALLARLQPLGFVDETQPDSVEHALRKLRARLKREVLHRPDFHALIPERRPNTAWAVNVGPHGIAGLSLSRLRSLRVERSQPPDAVGMRPPD